MTEYAFDFEMAQNLDHVEILIWLKKLATSEIKHVIEVLNHFECKPIRNQMNIPSCDNHLIR